MPADPQATPPATLLSAWPDLHTAPPKVVIDTNVVLDLGWFQDPRCRPLAQALLDGRLRWLLNEAMRVELLDVLGRVAFARSPDRCERVLAFVQALAISTNTTESPANSNTPRCADPDDQIFIDLAIGCGARWLFSRDRALLDLAPRMLSWGCTVLEPAAWNAGSPA